MALDIAQKAPSIKVLRLYFGKNAGVFWWYILLCYRAQVIIDDRTLKIDEYISGYPLVLNYRHKYVQNKENWFQHKQIQFPSTCANFKVLSMTRNK